MNERIRELAEQAGMSADKFGMFFAEDKHNEDGVDLEKFAELIVRECIGIADSHRMKMDSGPTYIIEDFKKHFGVEE